MESGTNRPVVLRLSLVDVLYQLNPSKSKDYIDFTCKSLKIPSIAIGIFLLLLSIVIFILDGEAQDLIIPYTGCSHVKRSKIGFFDKSTCWIPFTLSQPMKGKVFMYYRLTNFQRNHRRFARSKDDNQLAGRLEITDDTLHVSRKCAPYHKRDGKPVYPCGAIANAMFNDEFTLYHDYRWRYSKIPLINDDLAWPSDKQYKYKIPKDEKFQKLVKEGKIVAPERWNISLSDWHQGVESDAFIVWMTPSAKSTFRKLYAILNTTLVKDKHNLDYEGLPAGRYAVEIVERFHFNGTKSVVIATTSIFGTKNPFLYKLSLFLGVICLTLGILMAYVDWRFGGKLLFWYNMVYPHGHSMYQNDSRISARIPSVISTSDGESFPSTSERSLLEMSNSTTSASTASIQVIVD